MLSPDQVSLFVNFVSVPGSVIEGGHAVVTFDSCGVFFPQFRLVVAVLMVLRNIVLVREDKY